jgi:hypothetical protein
LSEEIRETKGLAKAVRDEVSEVRRLADAAKRQVDAALELVVLTRNEISRLLWKKWFGLN